MTFLAQNSETKKRNRNRYYALLIWINDDRNSIKPMLFLSSGGRQGAARTLRADLFRKISNFPDRPWSTDIWYVAFRKPHHGRVVYVRNSRTFPTEVEAKQFALDRLEEGCEVSAGTVNPHRPRQTIGSREILTWLDGKN